MEVRADKEAIQASIMDRWVVPDPYKEHKRCWRGRRWENKSIGKYKAWELLAAFVSLMLACVVGLLSGVQ